MLGVEGLFLRVSELNDFQIATCAGASRYISERRMDLPAQPRKPSRLGRLPWGRAGVSVLIVSNHTQASDDDAGRSTMLFIGEEMYLTGPFPAR